VQYLRLGGKDAAVTRFRGAYHDGTVQPHFNFPLLASNYPAKINLLPTPISNSMHFSIIFPAWSVIFQPNLILSRFIIYVVLHSSSFKNFRLQLGGGFLGELEWSAQHLAELIQANDI
jgi:hypothetical protein